MFGVWTPISSYKMRCPQIKKGKSCRFECWVTPYEKKPKDGKEGGDHMSCLLLLILSIQKPQTVTIIQSLELAIATCISHDSYTFSPMQILFIF
jgi:hypothetical protein